MQDVFFSATKKALANITATYDTVWPTAVGLWNLRCMVGDEKKAHPAITETELADKFARGSKIRGVNYTRAFIKQSWEKQQSDFAWILLNSSIPIFEGWLAELKQHLFTDLKLKEMQYPNKVRKEIARLTKKESAVLKNCFYPVYSCKRDRCYSQIDNLMYCYRVFKEARNCYMHNNLKANQFLLDAYKDYTLHGSATNLGVSEAPKFNIPQLNKPVEISLRGVVGFSYILIRILVSLDTELLRAKAAESEFISRYKRKHKVYRMLKKDAEQANRQVAGYVRQCGFSTPENIDEMKTFLLQKQLVAQCLETISIN